MSNSVELTIIAIDSASNILEGIGAKFGTLGELGAAAMTAISAAAVLAVRELGSLSEEGAKAEDVQALFNSVLKTSPLADYKDQLLKLAEAYSKTTRFEDENIVSAETVLLRYQNLNKDVMPLAIKTTLNLATALGTDATSAAQQLGKALEDIAGGSLSLLARTRLLTAEQKDAAVALAKSGDAAGAQSYILDILDKKMGTLAEDMGKTFAGKAQILQDAMSQLREEMGTKLNDALKPLLGTFQELFDEYAPMISEAFDMYVIPAINRTVDAIQSILSFLDVLSYDFTEGLKTGDWSAFWTDIRINAEIGLKSLKEITASVDIVVGNWIQHLSNTIRMWANGPGPKKLGDDLLGWIKGIGTSSTFNSYALTAANGLVETIGAAISRVDWGPIDLALGQMMQNAFNSMMNKFADWAGVQLLGLFTNMAQFVQIQFTGALNKATGYAPAEPAPKYTKGQQIAYNQAAIDLYNSQTIGPMHAHASGGSFLIPQSYGNEGFRMGNGDTASGGETVTIGKGGTQGGFTFVYSPTFSMGNKSEAENVIAPIIAATIRRMQVDGRI